MKLQAAVIFTSLQNAKLTSIAGYTSCRPTYIVSFMVIFGQCINVLNYNANYKPNINFRAILLATSRHVVQITGRISRNNARLHLYLSSDYFRQNETKSAEKKAVREFQLYLHGRKTNSLCRVQHSDSDTKRLVENAVPESRKKSTKYAVNVFEGEESYE